MHVCRKVAVWSTDFLSNERSGVGASVHTSGVGIRVIFLARGFSFHASLLPKWREAHLAHLFIPWSGGAGHSHAFGGARCVSAEPGGLDVPVPVLLRSC